MYLCAIKDCYSNRIVGYSIDSRMEASLAVNALRMAIILRGRPAETIVHSDRGSQFLSKKNHSHACQQQPARLDGQGGFGR